MKYDEIGGTTLFEIAERTAAKELEEFAHAQALLELEMMNVSARSLGEAEERVKTQDEITNDARQEKLGQPIKAQMHRDILFKLMPPHQKAAYVHTYGWPGETKSTASVEPLEGVDRQCAETMVTLLKDLRFSRGSWMNSPIWTQLRKPGAKARLEKTAEG